jgi:beta-glucuronidase
MLRTFQRHAVRTCEPMDGLWDFVTADDRRDRRKLPSRFPRTLRVPSAWETLPGLEAYRGRGWLRTFFCGDEGRAVRLVFGGVSHTADVYVDGKRRGGHHDAFTPWDVVVPNLRGDAHELIVEVDNTFGEHSALHRENDYYTYGGITRPVELQLVPAAYVERAFAVPVRRRGRWDLHLRVRLRNWSRREVSRRLLVLLEDRPFDLGMVTVPPGGARETTGGLTALDVQPWTPADPRLYELDVLVLDGEELADDMIERVGFRDVKVRGRKLLLNGQPLRLRGVNRHEDHPQFGCALPVEAMMTDLQLLRDLGANFVRTSHYPNDMRFLDLCDELGLCVWEESHARSVDFKHPRFRGQIADSTREMIEWHHNHPSIVLWGCLNECDSRTAAGRREHRRVLELIRQLDPSRPRTFASNRGQQDVCLDLVDVVSWNRYDAWYAGRPDDVEPALRRALKWLHSPASKASGKPVILSEFGAGALYGCRQRHRAKWSEEYQADVLDESLRVYLNHPDVCGAAIWQFCDVRVCGPLWRGRPRTMNNKGVVDEHRRPKLAYEAVRRRMRQAARADRRRPKR